MTNAPIPGAITPDDYATRISNDGIYLHELEDTIWAQGNTNVSHGCLNLSRTHAQWFYDFSVPGGIVEVRNTGGAALIRTDERITPSDGCAALLRYV